MLTRTPKQRGFTSRDMLLPSMTHSLCLPVALSIVSHRIGNAPKVRSTPFPQQHFRLSTPGIHWATHCIGKAGDYCK